MFEEAIFELVARERPALLVPTVPGELSSMSRFKQRLRALGVQLFLSEPAVLDLADDKYRTALQLREQRIPTPRTLLASNHHDYADMGETLGYPFLVRARMGHNNRGVTIYRRPSEARHEKRTDLVCQELLDGEECDLNLFAYPAGHVKAVAVLHRTRLQHGLWGKALDVQRIIRRDLAELGIRVARALKLEGLIHIDARRDGHGTPRVLEITACAGTNLSTTSDVLDSLLFTAFQGD
jgi:carbamoyl-phosphate synthase large subunit